MINSCGEFFPGACRYRALWVAGTAGVREGTAAGAFPWSERHLRCVWVDPAWRPAPLITGDNRQVWVESPGRWNLEAGPDFLDAVLRTGPDESTLRGDVEIHIHPADWRHHGHTGDPRYRNIIAHVTYFQGDLDEADLPPSVLQIALRPALRKIPSFSFDGLDLPSYPFASLAPLPPCAESLKGWSPEQQGLFLEAAGEERLRRKTERMVLAMAGGDPAQTLYEEVMGALGFKHNRVPFHNLAQALPLHRLRRDSGGNVNHAYALLAGVSGLLPAKTGPLWDEESRLFVRSLWDVWWKHQAGWHGNTLQRSDWSLANVRPANNPLRRLMAAASLFADIQAPFERVIASCVVPGGAEGAFPSSLLTWLGRVGGDTFWARRAGLAAPCAPVASALIGPGRAAALVNNVLVPWLAASGARPPEPGWLKALPAEDDNRYIRQSAHALFGHDHNPALYRSGLRQQGLLQIFQDFCLNSRNGCRGCRLPEMLREEAGDRRQ